MKKAILKNRGRENRKRYFRRARKNRQFRKTGVPSGSAGFRLMKKANYKTTLTGVTKAITTGKPLPARRK